MYSNWLQTCIPSYVCVGWVPVICIIFCLDMYVYLYLNVSLSILLEMAWRMGVGGVPPSSGKLFLSESHCTALSFPLVQCYILQNFYKLLVLDVTMTFKGKCISWQGNFYCPLADMNQLAFQTVKILSMDLMWHGIKYKGNWKNANSCKNAKS